jgi:hypothetical protein
VEKEDAPQFRIMGSCEHGKHDEWQSGGLRVQMQHVENGFADNHDGEIEPGPDALSTNVHHTKRIRRNEDAGDGGNLHMQSDTSIVVDQQWAVSKVMCPSSSAHYLIRDLQEKGEVYQHVIPEDD